MANVIDTIYIQRQEGGEDAYPIGAKAKNVTYNRTDSSDVDPNSVNNKLKQFDEHNEATAAINSVNGVHGIRYTGTALQVKNTSNQWISASGSGDMKESDYIIPGSQKIIATDHGGTGNNSGYIRVGALTGSTIGLGATVEGGNNVASGNYSHAEGIETQAIGNYSHAEGYDTIANLDYSHAEGEGTITGGEQAHAEGCGTIAGGNSSHAEGAGTYAEGICSHAEGSNTKAEGIYSHAEGSDTQAIGNYSHAEGCKMSAYGEYSHSEGFSNYIKSNVPTGDTYDRGGFGFALGDYSHNEGYCTQTVGGGSHAEGQYTQAKGNYSHAEGYNTSATGQAAHSEGNDTHATGGNSHAEGYSTYASNECSHASGHYSAAMVDTGTIHDQNGTAFVIGNGTQDNYRTNAFSIQFDGTVAAAGTITGSTTADYAEFFEWTDNNSQNEDRVGYFVTFDKGKKIKIASAEDDYILGIVSGAPFVLGNGDCDVWNGIIIRDEFNRIQYEPAPKYRYNEETKEEELVFDEQGNQIYEGMKPVYNSNYDASQVYIPRRDRAEQAPVGMLGVLSVRDDGTCEVNGYCTVAEGGIATKATSESINKYRVIGRKTNNVIEVVFR